MKAIDLVCMTAPPLFWWLWRPRVLPHQKHAGEKDNMPIKTEAKRFWNRISLLVSERASRDEKGVAISLVTP
jgi:hypothetical protein